jgi:hypothetical protein
MVVSHVLLSSIYDALQTRIARRRNRALRPKRCLKTSARRTRASPTRRKSNGMTRVWTTTTMEATAWAAWVEWAEWAEWEVRLGLSLLSSCFDISFQTNRRRHYAWRLCLQHFDLSLLFPLVKVMSMSLLINLLCMLCLGCCARLKQASIPVCSLACLWAAAGWYALLLFLLKFCGAHCVLITFRIICFRRVAWAAGFARHDAGAASSQSSWRERSFMSMYAWT